MVVCCQEFWYFLQKVRFWFLYLTLLILFQVFQDLNKFEIKPQIPFSRKSMKVNWTQLISYTDGVCLSEIPLQYNFWDYLYCNFRYGGGYQMGQLLSEVAGGFTTEDMYKEVSNDYTKRSHVVRLTFVLPYFKICAWRVNKYDWALIDNRTMR